MERTLWILSKFSFRITVVLLGLVDFYAYSCMYETGEITTLIARYKWLLLLLCIIVLISCIVCSIYGGKLGYKYVEMGRSRRWHYKATEYEQKDSRLRNTLYWAGKFALIPIIITQILILAFALTLIL